MKKNQKPINVAWYNKPNVLLIIGIGGILLLSGIMVVLFQVSAQNGARVPTVVGKASQSIRMTVTAGEYIPSTFTVPTGKPITWTVDGTKSAGCTAYLVSPELGISKKLAKGDNTIEFTAPTKPGVYKFSCSMDMVRGSMIVVGEDGAVPEAAAQIQNAAPAKGSSCGAGCGCGMA
jgi:plastocyanin domain-containing protein